MELVNQVRSFYDAIENKDIEKIKSTYYPDEKTYVVLEGPRFTTLGVTKIFKGWVDFCNSPIGLEKIEWIEGPFSEMETEMGWLSGIIDIFVSIEGRRFSNRFRASFVFKKKDGEWKIRHEHVSAPMEDPYGVGDWLKK